MEDVNTTLKEAGLETLPEEKCFERIAYFKHLDAPSESRDKEWVKKLKGLKENYLANFYKHFAITYPHLRFEVGEEKVYWMYSEERGVYDELNVSTVRELTMNLLIADGLASSVSPTLANTILAKYRAIYIERGSVYDDFDNEDDWFHCKNGWIHLKLEEDGTREFKEHSPSIISRRVSDAIYDPKATCPEYDDLLDKRFRLSKDKVRVLDQYSGLILTPDISKQKMLAMIGEAGTGKSTLIELWTYMLGDCATKNSLKSISSEGARFMGSSLIDRTLCWFDEVEPNRTKMGDDLIGMVTAHTLSVERKGINGITKARNKLKFILTANALPRSAEIGIYRRLILINFTYSFTDNNDVDPNINEKLYSEKELSGVFNRMLKGLADLQKIGDFAVIENHTDLIEDYKTSSNVIAEFLDEHFTFDESAEPLLTKTLLGSYKEFTGDKYSQSLTPQRFGVLLSQNGLYQFRNIQTTRGAGGVRQWIGLRLKDRFEISSANLIIEKDDF